VAPTRDFGYGEKMVVDPAPRNDEFVQSADLAPVAVFAFRRPGHLAQTLDALRANDLAARTDLWIFVDGPRGPQDVEAVAGVLEIAKSAAGFCSLQVEASAANKGLSRSIIDGISLVLRRTGRVIVVEDDIVVSRHFLGYMNGFLDLYQDDHAVASIHGYVYPHPDVHLDPTFFIRGADCWGWGTWQRAWDAFESDGAYLLNELRARHLLDVFNFEGTAPYEEMLIDQIAGRNDSWAVRWYASALLKGMLTLYPSEPMALNIGEDGSGTHRGSSHSYHQVLATELVPLRRIPLVESVAGRQAFRGFFRGRYRLPSNALARWVWRRAHLLKVALDR
jgi:hypothetical protein